MKNSLLYFILIASFIGLQSCGLSKDVGSSSSQAQTATNGALIQVYMQTIVAVSSPATGTAGRCVDCHTTRGSQPSFPFADSNAATAFASGITRLGLVDIITPANSRLLLYLTNNHCGGAQCNSTTGSAIYNTFLAAAQSYAQAATAMPTTGTPSPAPSALPSTLPVAALGGLSAAPVPMPANPPLLGSTPLLLMIPLKAANAAAGTSAIQFSVAYTVVATNSAGGVAYLYDLYDPVLINTTPAQSITVSGFYLAVNGVADIGNNLFAHPTQYYATATPNSSKTLNPNGTLGSMSFLASPGDSLTLVLMGLKVGN